MTIAAVFFLVAVILMIISAFVEHAPAPNPPGLPGYAGTIYKLSWASFMIGIMVWTSGGHPFH
jgi:hypothetical protein